MWAITYLTQPKWEKFSEQIFTSRKKYMVKSKTSGQNQVIIFSGQKSGGQKHIG